MPRTATRVQAALAFYVNELNFDVLEREASQTDVSQEVWKGSGT